MTEYTEKITNIFDSHSHYDDSWFDEDRAELINRQLSDNVLAIMHAATDLESSRYGLKAAGETDRYFTSVGIHPSEVDKLPDDWKEQLIELAKNPLVRAIGEIGMDYHYEGYDKLRQIEVFEFQLELAKELSLPVIVHIRDCTEDCMQILKKHRPKGVVHCFSGSAETAKEVLELGMYISFTGALTFKGAKRAAKALEVIPLDRLMLETDCPYMTPEPVRPGRCQSDMIEHTARKAAEIKGINPQQLVDICTNNTMRLFNIEKIDKKQEEK